MKKFGMLAALALSVSTTALLLAGCSSSGSSSSSSAGSVVESAVEEAKEVVESVAESAAAVSGFGADTQAIVDRGVLKVGVKNAVQGFGFQDALTGEYTGMEIDLGQMIADYLGVDVEYTTVTAATRGELLDSGDIDCVLATFTITDERKENWDFTTPYYTDYVTVLVELSSGIATLEDLVGKTVGVSSGSTSAKSLVNALIDSGVISGDGYSDDTFDPATWTEGVSFRQYDDYPTISTALSAGEVDAFCVDKSILAIYKTDSRTYIEEDFSPQDYGAATKKGSDFSDLCEELITGWLADGTVDGLIANYGLD